jgi:signal peptidase I
MSAEVTSPTAESISDPLLASPAPDSKPQIPPVALPEKVVAPRRSSWAFLAGQWVAILLLAAASYFLISHFFLQSVRVVGISMVPTLQDSQRYLLNRWVLFLRAPHRDDIVVLRDPSDHGYSVKRVVAVAGDSVKLDNGHVYVNGRQLEEPYLAPGTSTFPSPTSQRQTFTCSKNEFFVLGDNRPRSIDSRAYGPVPRANILGLIIR